MPSVAAPEASPSGAPERSFHTVGRGDTLWGIAERHLANGERWKELAKLNALKNPDAIQVGQKIELPLPPSQPAAEQGAEAGAEVEAPTQPAAVSEESGSSSQVQPSLDVRPQLPPAAFAELGTPTGELPYVVQRGDTLWEIALRYYDDPGRWRHIQRSNGLRSDKLAIGQKLTLTELPVPTFDTDFDPDAQAEDFGAFATDGPVQPGNGDFELSGDGALGQVAADEQGDFSLVQDDYAGFLGEVPPALQAPLSDVPPTVMSESPTLGQAPQVGAAPTLPGPMGEVDVSREPPQLATPEQTDVAPGEEVEEASGEFIVTDHQALLRSEPPLLAPSGGLIPVGTQVDVVAKGSKGRREYALVAGVDGVELGWTSMGNLSMSKTVDPELAANKEIPLDGLQGLERSVAHIYNTNGDYLEQQAAGLGIDVALAVAIVQVESNGKAFGSDGRVVIRFENHYFRKLLGSGRRSEYNSRFSDKGWRGDTHQWRASDDADWQSVHNRGQAGEWRALEAARAIDDTLALQSISMGAGQTMGDHYERKLGYDSPQDMLAAYDSGVKPQLDGIFDYMRSTPLCMKGLANEDYETIAAGYNGSGQKKTYGRLIRKATEAFRAVRSKNLAPMTSPRPQARPSA